MVRLFFRFLKEPKTFRLHILQSLIFLWALLLTYSFILDNLVYPVPSRLELHVLQHYVHFTAFDIQFSIVQQKLYSFTIQIRGHVSYHHIFPQQPQSFNYPYKPIFPTIYASPQQFLIMQHLFCLSRRYILLYLLHFEFKHICLRCINLHLLSHFFYLCVYLLFFLIQLISYCLQSN